MCGIVGAIAKRNIVPTLIDCLKRLEYRGYDSAGVAVLNEQRDLTTLRVVGKISGLDKALEKRPFHGTTAIVHTRWATHGAPTEINAHPHSSHDEIALVHNGIIDNYQELRAELLALGYKFSSDTDTEVIAHSIYRDYQEKADFLAAVHKTVQRLVGMYSLAIIHSREPDRVIGVRNGSPLVVGIGTDEFFVASDRLALAKVAEKFIYLEDGDIADLSSSGVTIYDFGLRKANREIKIFNVRQDSNDRGSYRHYMQKEIFEQPLAITNTLKDRLDSNFVADNVFGALASDIFPLVKRVQIVACGTSYHAGLTAKFWLENFANIPCQVDVASEFRYRKNIVEPNTLLVVISQSGETADILAVVKKVKQFPYLATLAICNVAESSLVRETDLHFITLAGIEIGVASTKAFTTQLVALLLLTLALGKYHALDEKTATHFTQYLRYLPNVFADVLALDDSIGDLAKLFINKQNALFLGRGICFPIALEGALKMKEISYIHAEAFAAGELKHGPLALVDCNMPVIVLMPNDDLLLKLRNNINEVAARGGELIVITDGAANSFEEKQIRVLKMPAVAKEVAPIIYTVPLQLLAYHVAVLKGTDVDQPRNLAKSVTVE